MPRPILAHIHAHALAHNLSVARTCAPQSRVWAVVKANAYGHDIAHAFAGLQHADGFALLDLNEAVQVRELGWKGPILLLEGIFEMRDWDIVEAHGLTAAIHHPDHLRMLAERRPSQPLSIYLKMNSGMNRLGFTPDAYRDAYTRARALPAVGPITLMTHFATADGPQGISSQMTVFEQATQNLPGERSLSNSAATLWHGTAHRDWVRPGVMLYGASPSGIATDVAERLKPAMTLESRLLSVQTLRPGDTVGYGATFAAQGPMRIGVVACGYADGYPRTAPEGTPVVVDGIRTRLVGRVSMDMLTVDLTPCPNATAGSAVELWGAQLPVDDVANACGTIGYELLTAVTARVRRVSDLDGLGL